MVSKVQGPDTEEWVTTEEVFEAATIGSAKALGLGERVGALPRLLGRHCVPRPRPHELDALQRSDEPARSYEDGTGVHSVIVAGRMVVEDRAVVGVDMARLAARVEASRERLQAFNEPVKGLCEVLSTVVNAFCQGSPGPRTGSTGTAAATRSIEPAIHRELVLVAPVDRAGWTVTEPSTSAFPGAKLRQVGSRDIRGDARRAGPPGYGHLLTSC